eukprot:gb/GECG01002762.1/.p1 GENE.gb/GECG01002762.1/~~gb/GECG01002762.1/.p1  ORF type:complete len:551 (+),score=85.32 gb/GECG01002762.1/:1-1653(+)
MEEPPGTGQEDQDQAIQHCIQLVDKCPTAHSAATTAVDETADEAIETIFKYMTEFSATLHALIEQQKQSQEGRDQNSPQSAKRKKLSATVARLGGMLRDVVERVHVEITDEGYSALLEQFFQRGHASSLVQFSRRFGNARGWPPQEGSHLAHVIKERSQSLLESDPASVGMLQNALPHFPLAEDGKVLNCCLNAKSYNLAITLAQRFEFSAQKELVQKLIELNEERWAWKAIKRLNVNPALFPELQEKQARKFLSWVLKEDTPLRDSLIDAVVENIPALKGHVVEKLLSHFGIEHHWTRKYVHKLGLTSQYPSVKPPQEDASEAIALHNEAVRLPNNVGVHFIHNLEQLESAVSELCYADYVGFDSEWCPIEWAWKPLGNGQYVRYDSVALLQLATINSVFLVDMLMLTSNCDMDAVNSMFERLLGRVTPTIVAFGIKGDLNQVCKSYPQLTAFHDGWKHLSEEELSKKFWDLHLDYDKFVTAMKESTTSENAHQPSLKNLVYEVYSKHMDKRVRLSDWTKRPLHEAQIEYASLDAWLLVDMVNIWKAAG